MRNCFVLIFVISTLTITINCSSISHRTKRNSQGIIDKVKTGLIDFGVGTKNLITKGYEETKNIFSSDRKVGDYILNDINVRSNFNHTDIQEATDQQIESVTIRTKREQKWEKEENEKIDELPDDHEGEEQNKSEDLNKKEEKNDDSEILGPPPAGFILLIPLSCKEKQVLVRGICRPLA